MKIVISDYPDVLGRDLEKEYACLHEVLPEAEIVTHPYADAAAFFREIQDADGLLTAFIPLDKQALDRMPRLKAISVHLFRRVSQAVRHAVQDGGRKVPKAVFHAVR